MMPIICHRQTAASTAPMPDARAWRRGQVPQPRSGAPKAQDLTAAITVAAPSHVPSIAPDDVMAPDSTGADAPMNAFITPRIYTSLTDVTEISSSQLAREHKSYVDGPRVQGI